MEIQTIIKALNFIKSGDYELIELGESILRTEFRFLPYDIYIRFITLEGSNYESYIRRVLWNDYNIKIAINYKNKYMIYN